MKSLMRYLNSLIHFSKKRFILGCGLTLINTFCSGMGLLMLIPLLHYVGVTDNQYLSSSSSHYFHLSLIQTLSVFFILMSAFSLIEYFSSKVIFEFQKAYLFSFQQRLNRAIANAEWGYILSQHSKRIEHMLITGLMQLSTLTSLTMQCITALIMATTYFLFSCWVSWQLTFITVLLGGALLYFARKNTAVASGEKMFNLQKQLQEMLGRFLTGVKLAKSSNMVSSYLKQFDEINARNVTIQCNFYQEQRQSALMLRLTSIVLFILIFSIAFYCLHIHWARLLTLLAIFSRIISPLSILQQQFLRLLNLTPIVEQAEDMITEFEAHQEIFTADAQSISLKKSIIFNKITFFHGEKNILMNFDAIIPAQQMTVIIGKSGAGKSTIADLLMGLFATKSGRIMIDETLLSTKNILAWRKQITYVPQEGFYFHDTIRANLMWSTTGCDDEAIYAALKLVEAEEMITRLPNGLDALMGDRGIQFSGGERQRLGLARALLRKPSILLLDEATSALDRVCEEKIYRALRKIKNMTLIVITHREHIATMADNIIQLQPVLSLNNANQSVAIV